MISSLNGKCLALTLKIMVISVILAFSLHSPSALAELSCEYPDEEQPDDDGDECPQNNPNVNLPKNLGSDTSDCNSCTAAAGDPINYATGNKYEAELDYSSAGISPLVLRRFYNSNTILNTTNFGGGWRSSYSRSLNGPTPATPSSTVATVTRDDGRVYSFTLISGVWKPDSDVNSRLAELKDGNGIITGWIYLTANDETERYDAAGRLTSVANRAGVTQTVTHDGGGRLTSVTDPFGRKLIYAYAGASSIQIASVTAPDGGIYRYGYDTAGNLAAVAYPDNATRQFSYTNTSYMT